MFDFKIKYLFNCLLILVSGILLGFIMLLVVYSIPTKNMKVNAEKSVGTFLTEGTHPELSNIWTSQLDNWTDCVMLETAFYDGDENIIDKTLNCYRYTYSKSSTATEEYIKYFTKDEKPLVTQYARYWHGYLVFLKPLLNFFTYSQIRIINQVIQITLTIVIIYFMWIRKLKHIILPYILSICFLFPPALFKSMQFSTSFYIFSFAVLFIIINNQWIKKNKFEKYYFLIVGMITSYIDFLTYPISTLGIPIVLYFVLNREGNYKKNIISIVELSLFWGLGYVFMWAGKWILGSILTDNNVIYDAFINLGVRTSHNVSNNDFSNFYLIARNIKAFIMNPSTILSLLFFIIYIFKNKKYINKKSIINYLCIFGIVALMPFAWYIVTANHAFVHTSFTNKSLIVTSFAILCMISDIKFYNKN